LDITGPAGREPLPGPDLREHYERFEAAFERVLTEYIFA